MQTRNPHHWCAGEIVSPCCPESWEQCPFGEPVLLMMSHVVRVVWTMALPYLKLEGKLYWPKPIICSTPMASWLLQGKDMLPNWSQWDSRWVLLGLLGKKSIFFPSQETPGDPLLLNNVEWRGELWNGYNPSAFLKRAPGVAEGSQCGTWGCSQHCTSQSRTTKGI